MNINIAVGKDDLRKLVANFISAQTGQPVSPESVKIETKSTHNYKAEWEVADFRAVYSVITQP